MKKPPKVSRPRRLWPVLGAALASPLLLGCGPDPSLYEAPLCTPDGQLVPAGLQPASPVDYAELRRRLSGGGDDPGTVTAISSSGTRCATATDRPACEQALAMLTSTTGFLQSCVDACVTYYLATTQGDRVEAVASRDALLRFLGPIDTPQEAVLAAWSAAYAVSCGDKGRGAVRALDGGYEVLGTRGHGCGRGEDVVRYQLEVSRAGAVTVRAEEVIRRGDPNCAIGRRPAGLRPGRGRGRGALARYLASAARLEAASVAAFQQFAKELRCHGAPAALQQQALAAAADEVRHARLMTWLARRHGGCPGAVHVRPSRPRPLFAVALDNAVEGCVRETYGALQAGWQATQARDPLLRAALQLIAIDEARHAALSWQVAGWAERRLGRAERARLQGERRQAIAALRAELRTEPAEAVGRAAGLPRSEEALALWALLQARLWSRA